MPDKLSPQQRHRCMSHIRAKDTKPEMIVRRWLWADGYRYRLHAKNLPGKPDIVLRRLKTVIFVNGCFWHGHNVKGENGECFNGNIIELTDSDCCKIPHSNREFWLKKIHTNRMRDYRHYSMYLNEGWHVLVVWECMLKPKKREMTLMALSQRLNTIFLDTLRCKAKAYSIEEDAIGSMAAEDNSTGYNSNVNDI